MEIVINEWIVSLDKYLRYCLNCAIEVYVVQNVSEWFWFHLASMTSTKVGLFDHAVSFELSYTVIIAGQLGNKKCALKSELC